MSHPEEYWKKFSELLGDFQFLKFMVCAKNQWNPFDEKVKQLPEHFWLMSYKFIEMESHYKWKHELEPQAELTGMISNPEYYAHYHEFKEKSKKSSDVVINTNGGQSAYGKSDVHFEPGKGLVDADGNIVVNLKTLQKNNPGSGMFVG